MHSHHGKATYNIFLAASHALRNDRIAFGDIVQELNDALDKAGRETTFRLFKWEREYRSFADGRKQEDYNQAIEDCSVFVLLYDTKVGDYTGEEYDHAYERLRRTGMPKILVLKKDSGSPEDDSAKAFKQKVAGRDQQFDLHYHDDRSLKTAFVDEIQKLFEGGVLVYGHRPAKPVHLPYTPLGSLFKGRSKFISDLRASLDAGTGHTAAAITGRQALHGLGGIGKTRLAVEYAWQHEADYNALLCVYADTPQSLRANLAALCGALVLNLPEQHATEEQARVDAALRWLMDHPGWLLILDNVDNPEAATEVEAMLDKMRGGHVLITSRIRRWSRQVKPLELDVLDVDDAVEFLLERTEGERRKTGDDVEVACALAVELGQLALALEQAGAYICEHRMTLAGYAEAWQRNHDKLIAWVDAQQMQYPKSIAITWHTSFERLSPAARRLMNRLAWLSPEPIPESLLDIPVPGDETGDDAQDALAELHRYSLVTRLPDAPHFTVHRLVQDVACRMLEAEEQQTTLAEAIGWVDDAFVGDTQDVRNWPVLAPLAPHVLQLMREENAVERFAQSSRLFNELGTLLSAKARHAEAEPLMRRALDIDERSYGADHPRVAIDLNNLATLLQDTNRFGEAEPLMRRALAIDEQSYGADHPDVAIRLNNLAQLLQDTNRLGEAEPLMRRALDINERSYGADHPDVAIRLNNLAQLLKATNRLAEAEPLMRRALDIDERSYGADHTNVGRHLNNLATLLKATNRLVEAEPLMQRALDIDERSYGADHPDVAIRLNNLASLYYATNRLVEAEPLMRRALDIDERSYGADHPRVAIDLNNLATLLQATNRLVEAEPLMRRMVITFILFRKITSHGHPHLWAAINNYSGLLIKMGHTQEAAQAIIISLFNEALLKDREPYCS